MSEDDINKAAKTTRKPSTTKKAAAVKKSAPPKVTKSTAVKAASRKKPSAAKKTATPKAAAAKKTAAATKPSVKSKMAPKPKEGPASKPDKENISAAPNDDASNNYSSSPASDSDTFVEDLKGKDWGASLKRGIFMLIFGFVGQFTLSVTFFLAFLQFIVSLLVGPPNAAITSAIGTATRYLSEILAYLSFKTDDLPFPFGNDFPNEEND